VVRNLTPGFDKNRGFEYIAVPGLRWNSVPWLTWSPVGDRIAYFVHTEKQRSLIVQNIVTGKIEERIEMKPINIPEAPAFSRDSKKITFSALQAGVGDLFTIDLDSKVMTNITKDDFADYAPTYSPDGKYLVYLARVSGNDKLFRLDLDS